MRTPLIASVAWLAVATIAAAQTSPAQWTRTFQGEHSSDARRRMLLEVPTEKSPKAVALLLNVLADPSPARLDWWVRDGGIEALSRVPADERKALKLIDKVLERPKAETARLRADLITALGRSGDAAHVQRIVAALEEDPSAAVRRAAAFALRRVRAPEGAEALFTRLEKSWGGEPPKVKRGVEADGYRELVSYTRALADLAPVDHGRDVKAWLEWWRTAQDGFKLREDFTEADREELAKKAAEDATRTRTRTKANGVTIQHSSEGRGKIKLLVIHDSEWKGDYFRPWLDPLHDLVEVTYVRLPELADFDQTEIKLEKSPGGLPYMPVDALADAFDAIRKEKGAERFALLAHGFSTLVAARYVSRHPESVSHLVFVGGLTGDDAYGVILDEIERHGNNVWQDKETTNMVMNHYVDDEKTGRMIYEPKDEAEAIALQRKAFDLYWADPADPFVGEMFELCRTPVELDLEERREDIILSPEFEISREKKPAIPVLVMVGEKTLWSTVHDNERLAKNYPKGKLVRFANSGMFPFIEEPEKFQAELRKLLEQD